MAPKEVTKRETEEVQRSVEEDRKLVIQVFLSDIYISAEYKVVYIIYNVMQF